MGCNCTPVRVRFAPSPTGKPHTGNIRTALFDWLFARHTNGTFIFRVEDTDRKRLDPTAVDEMIAALNWIGLSWDEGPGVGGPYGPYVQSERLEIYQEYAQKLIASGNAYCCYCTSERLEALRESQESRGLPTGYDRRCRYLPELERRQYEESGALYTVRFAMPREGVVTWTDAVFGEMSWEARLVDDYIILKSDGFPLYHLAATVDDHLMKITHVIRGEEWLSTTALHLSIYKALGWTPPQMVHTTHILGPGRKKLSKREASAEFLNFKREGFLPEAVFNFVALIGWTPADEREILTRQELVDLFSISGLVGHPAILDPDKLLWFNAQYIKRLDPADLASRALPFLKDAGLVVGEPTQSELDYLGRVMALEQERIKTLAAAPELIDFFLQDDDKYVFDEKAVRKWFSSSEVAVMLQFVKERYEALQGFDPESTEAVVRDASEHFEVKAAQIIHPLRVAVTGRTIGPGLFETVSVLGQDRVIRRLSRAIGVITSGRH